MIVVDTNILVRYLIADPREPQTRVAVDFVDTRCSQEKPAVVTPVVLAELVWVLGSRYGFEKPDILAALEAIAHNANLRFEPEEEVLSAFDAYRDHAVDLADCLIAARAEALGITAATFDRGAARLPPFQLLQPGS